MGMSTLAAAQTLGRYRILGHLAAGGMAEILLASIDGPAGFQKLVVIKRVLPHLASRSEFRRMFLDEARIVAGLRHPNIVQVIELSREGNDLFLAMEYLEGESLQRLMRRLNATGERLRPVQAAHILAAACAGLHAAHENTAPDGTPQKLVHRDVSPQNLFLTYDGAVKVIDFGVAKVADRYTHTSTGQIKGKFGYMSPEQCLAEDVDRRTDVFALGIVLWEASTGARLFKRDNEMLVLKAICEDPLPKPSEIVADYPPSLERVVLRALGRHRDDRYATAAEMRRDLLAVVRELAPDEAQDDALAHLMNTAFADRIAQKKELVRAIGAGLAPESLEWLDASTGGFVPAAPAQSGLRASTQTRPPSTAPGRSRLRIAAALALALAAAGVGAWLTSGPTSTPAPAPVVAVIPPSIAPSIPEPPVSATPEPPSVPVPPPAVEREPEPAPAPALVVLDIESVPVGAEVVVGGTSRGLTPLALSLPRGTDAIDVVLSRRGYRTTTERIVPDVDQRLRVALPRERGRARPDEGFERFD